MAEGRMLKKKISMSKRVAELSSDSCRLLYTWIIPHLDIEGRIHADPAIVKGQVVPRIKTLTERNIDKYLHELHKHKLITLYEADGDKYLQVNNFEINQKLRKDRERASEIPTPGALREHSGSTPGVNAENSGVREDKISKDKIREDKIVYVHFEKKVVEGWNKLCAENPQLSKIATLSDTRKKHLKKRFSEKIMPEKMDEIFQMISESDFLLNGSQEGNHKTWRIDFDWLIKNDTNYVKVLEGKYNGQKKRKVFA